MNEIFVLRRANGELFNEQKEGKLTVPVWSSQEALDRYRERNPELMTFLSTPLTRALINRLESGLGGRTIEFFLLAEDDPNAELDDGKPISLEQIFPAGERAGQRVQPQI